MGEVPVPADKLWGAQTKRSLEHSRIGQELIPRVRNRHRWLLSTLSLVVTVPVMPVMTAISR